MSEINDAAVEAAARALHADACGEDPDDSEPCSCGSYEREARAALAAALPHLTSEPCAPEASREAVAGVLQREFGLYLAHDPRDPERFWSLSVDALLARFTITPKETRDEHP